MIRLLEDASNELPLALRQLIDRLTCHLKEIDRQVRELEREILAWHRSSDLSRKLEQIPGIGHSPLPHWLPQSPMPGASTMAGSYRLGSGWCRDRTPAAGSPRY
jgi:hypothetical protein